MRYLLRVTEHLAKKFERVILTHVRQDDSEKAFCLRSLSLINAFLRAR